MTLYIVLSHSILYYVILIYILSYHIISYYIIQYHPNNLEPWLFEPGCWWLELQLGIAWLVVLRAGHGLNENDG
jgi:hypothetical protein